MLAAGVASAEEPLQLELDISASICASSAPVSVETLGSELALRVRRPVVVQRGAPAVLHVRIDAARDSFIGHATFEGASGRDERDIEGTSCTEIVQALAFVASSWLEAEPEVVRLSPAAAPPPAVAPRPIRPADVPPTTRPPAVALPASKASRLRAGWRSGVVLGFVSRPALDVTAAGGVTLGAGGTELRGGVRLTWARNTVELGSVQHRWLTIPLDACRNVRRERITAGLCGRVDPGLFLTSITAARSFEAHHALAWLDAGAGLRLSASLGGVDLELDAFALVPVTGYRIERDLARLEGLRSVAVSIGLGAMLPIP